MQIGKPKGTKTMVTSSDVLQTIIDLYQSNPPREATRKTISHELGVAFRLVDDHVDRLLERGKIRRVLAGVFAPVEVQRDKVVSSTHGPGGRTWLLPVPAPWIRANTSQRKRRKEMIPTNESAEQWRDVVGWEGLYQVSDAGHVRSVPRSGNTSFGTRTYGGGVVRVFPQTNGYLCVNLSGNGVRKQILLHKLVLEAFVGPRPDGMQACHRNGNRADPSISNLRWDTVSNNHLDKNLHGTGFAGERNPNASLTDEAVLSIRTSHESLNQLAARHGVSRGCVEKAKYGSTWRHV